VLQLQAAVLNGVYMGNKTESDTNELIVSFSFWSCDINNRSAKFKLLVRSSHSNPLLLVVDLLVQVIEVLDGLLLSEGLQGLLVLLGSVRVLALHHEGLPL
jgi:hypothetical protein